MRSWKSRVLLFLLAVMALGQMPVPKSGVNVLRVGHRLACLCGCTDTVATCSMLECHFAKPAKARIAELQLAGMSDQAIIDEFVQKHGEHIFRAEPNAWGWVVPYAAIGFGLVAIWIFVKRYRRPQPLPELGPEPEDPALAKYGKQIEKDLAQLD
jgi:cytochrome c-type biogenesis protein CcmH/NrfF